jgi:hypothetical protein
MNSKRMLFELYGPIEFDVGIDLLVEEGIIMKDGVVICCCEDDCIFF